jgi:hypothetical protein
MLTAVGIVARTKKYRIDYNGAYYDVRTRAYESRPSEIARHLGSWHNKKIEVTGGKISCTENTTFWSLLMNYASLPSQGISNMAGFSKEFLTATGEFWLRWLFCYGQQIMTSTGCPIWGVQSIRSIEYV